MTSASELFYTRRSRVGRPDPDSGIGSSIERNHLSHHHNRHDLDGVDSLRRSSHVRHFSSRASSLTERPSVRVDEGISELVSSNGLTADIVNSSRRQSLRSNERLARARFDEGTSELILNNGLNVDGVSNVSGRSLSSDERLPGAVLLARARLLERLRGMSVSGNRQSSRTPRNAYRREHVSDDDLRSVTEISTGLAPRGSPLTSETERFQLLHETSKKPPGLTQEAVNRLPLEVFSSQEVDVERKTSRESRDCSICLDSFGEEDVLTRLPCGHRFHFACLDPWVRMCGDCPYCRRSIL
ncbi:RING/U-box superfamily protein, putative isoform 2 [Hibiscus syriacus]|uniref:RING/U-box superfamily protein, putative isoform 2 n=1 Tax=Hibiscus syriacus TaxID=106335 RepID=A0A6A3A2S5_HIBSY|nr:probable E3 ubiquitin-protein ligase RHY1A [Hibiscus syriacus]KAE8698581.1 RING/U-box superfamily protein, putative isoform 2 [Hibiscus syriacus]